MSAYIWPQKDFNTISQNQSLSKEMLNNSKIEIPFKQYLEKVIARIDWPLKTKSLEHDNIYNYKELLQLQSKIHQTGLVVEMVARVCDGATATIRKLQSQ